LQVESQICFKKKLAKITKVLCETDNCDTFASYCKKFAIYLNIPEANDALISLTTIMNSRNKARLPQSSLFPLLSKLGVDFQREINNKLRRQLMDMVLKGIQDPMLRRYLIRKDIAHALVDSLLLSCEGKNEIEGVYIKDLINVLCNLTYSDKLRFYIPGETIKQEKIRRKFLLWGGLIGLYYFINNTRMKDVSELCGTIRIKTISLRDYEDMLKVLKLHLESLNESELDIEDTLANTKDLDEEIVEMEHANVPNIDNAKPKDVQFSK